MALSNVHRASSLKQQNKKHKNLGHRTKGQLKSSSGGRISLQNLSKAHKNELSRKQRRHQSKQIRANKREEALHKKRQLGTSYAPPFLTAIVPVSININPRLVLQYLTNFDETSTSKMSKQGIMHLSCSRLKQRFSFVIPPLSDLYAIMDTVKVCDTVLFVWKIGEEVSNCTEQILSSLRSQGMPSVVHAVMDDDELPHKKKMRLIKELHLDISSRFPSNSRHYFLNKMQDVNLILRQIGSQRRQPIFFRDQRSHMIAEKVLFESEDSSSGVMKLFGYIRGQPLSVNRLIHIPGWGEFQISRLESLDDPFPLDLNRRAKKDEVMVEEEPKLLDLPDPQLQETLESSIDGEPYDEEQTWPTPEEIQQAISDTQMIKKTRKLPRGTSDYQSTWIFDSDDEDKDNSDNESDRDSAMDLESNSGKADFAPLAPSTEESDQDDDTDEEDVEDAETLTLTDVADDYDNKMDYKEEFTLLEKIKAAKEDSLFPDEVDTPMDLPSRLRFQKYRGLQSFRTSPWDTNENLPPDYRRIIYFKNFTHTKKKIFKADKEGALPGWYVVVHLKDVPRHLYIDHVKSQSPLAAFSLLPYEQKISVVNFVLKSYQVGHAEPIQSKERLIFHVGFRRFSNMPIFSEHTNGDKHKFVRFFQPGQTVVASMFAPVTFPSCPITVFKQNEDGSQDLIATGPFLSADPNRIICKRVVLSGHPFKISRKSAVVRYMFFNPEDVLWFKSVELRTKWGRRGHIKEPLGTHGHMKCQFDGPLKSQDTVLLNLFKRVFPKWRFDPLVPRPSPYFGTISVPGRSSSGRKSNTNIMDDISEDSEQPRHKKKKVQFQGFLDRPK